MLKPEKYDLTSETIEFDSKIEFNGNLWVLDPEKGNNSYDRTTFLNITTGTDVRIHIRIDWCNYSITDSPFTTLLISETGKLFFAAKFFWGLIDLEKVSVIRQESCLDFWSFERSADTIVIITELAAESMTISGETIDKVPIDPPWESKDFEDRIEFDSPVFGQQTLKLKK